MISAASPAKFTMLLAIWLICFWNEYEHSAYISDSVRRSTIRTKSNMMRFNSKSFGV